MTKLAPLNNLSADAISDAMTLFHTYPWELGDCTLALIWCEEYGQGYEYALVVEQLPKEMYKILVLSNGIEVTVSRASMSKITYLNMMNIDDLGTQVLQIGPPPKKDWNQLQREKSQQTLG